MKEIAVLQKSGAINAEWAERARDAAKERLDAEKAASFVGIQELYKRIQAAAATVKTRVTPQEREAVAAKEAQQQAAQEAGKGRQQGEKQVGVLERIHSLLLEVKQGLPLVGAFGA